MVNSEENNQKPTQEPLSGGNDETPIFVTITEEEVEKIKQESAECKDKYVRLLAEMENMRKRMYKERQELIQFAIQNVIIEFLNPIDNLENALKFATTQASEEIKQWALGFQMILNQFRDVLTSHGVSPFESIGTPFDPHHHEAVETRATTEFKQGTVISENLKGYRMSDRTIRPARVVVAKDLEKDEPKIKKTEE